MPVVPLDYLEDAMAPKALAREEAPRTPRVRSINELVLDLDRMRVTWKDQPLSVTITEFMILLTLTNRPGVYYTRDMLLDQVWRDDGDMLYRAVDSHMKRLRKKFWKVDPGFNRIVTMYGVGYRWEDGQV